MTKDAANKMNSILSADEKFNTKYRKKELY